MQQERFVLAYVAEPNATKAAIAAGYSEKTAKQQGSRLLTSVDVSTAIAQANARLVAMVELNTGVSVSRVVEEYARIAFADMRHFAEVGPDGVTLKSSAEWADADAAAVSEVGETVSKEGGSLRFKLHNKVAALDALAKHLRMFGDEPSGDRHLHLHGLTDEQLKALASGISS